MEPTPLFSKRVIDPINTAAWFAMDAFWIFRLAGPAFVFTGLTILTGLLLLVLGRREGRRELFADLGLNCWILMNTIWLVADLTENETPLRLVAVVATLGAGFILAAAWHSQDLRRLRIRGR